MIIVGRKRGWELELFFFRVNQGHDFSCSLIGLLIRSILAPSMRQGIGHSETAARFLPMRIELRHLTEQSLQACCICDLRLLRSASRLHRPASSSFPQSSVHKVNSQWRRHCYHSPDRVSSQPSAQRWPFQHSSPLLSHSISQTSSPVSGNQSSERCQRRSQPIPSDVCGNWQARHCLGLSI